MLPNDSITKDQIPCTKQLIDVYKKYHSSAILSEEVQIDKVEKYGINNCTKVENNITKSANWLKNLQKKKYYQILQ